MKTETRKLSELIQAKTGKSLVFINYQAMQFVEMGLVKTRKEALEYMLDELC